MLEKCRAILAPCLSSGVIRPAVPADLKRPNMEDQDVRKVTFLCSSPLLIRKSISCHDTADTGSTAVSNYLQSAIASCFFLFWVWFGVKELSLFPALSCTYLPLWTRYRKAQHGRRNLWMSVWYYTEKFLSLACLKIKQRKSIQSFPQSCSKSTKPWKTLTVKKNVTVVAKSCTKMLVNIKMESSLIMKFFHACTLGLNLQLNKQLRMQSAVIIVISL